MIHAIALQVHLQNQVILNLCMTSLFSVVLFLFFFNDMTVYTQAFSYQCSASGHIIGSFCF